MKPHGLFQVIFYYDLYIVLIICPLIGLEATANFGNQCNLQISWVMRQLYIKECQLARGCRNVIFSLGPVTYQIENNSSRRCTVFTQPCNQLSL